MSECWHLVCDKTKKKLWIGQGNNGIELYSGDEKVMSDLEAFLRKTAGNPLVLVNDQDERSFMYDDFTESEAFPTDTELLDWLSNIHCASFERHYEPFTRERTVTKEGEGYTSSVDFFSIESQRLKDVPNLRVAIAQAMRIAARKDKK